MPRLAAAVDGAVGIQAGVADLQGSQAPAVTDCGDADAVMGVEQAGPVGPLEDVGFTEHDGAPCLVGALWKGSTFFRKRQGRPQQHTPEKHPCRPAVRLCKRDREKATL